ncbi:uncharacterized protein LOC132030984 isoform X4 [Lycium ferocissimum]|uniref:uncharacterized protein LOC132030984 isoform X4 n=1 Tax=Lycium ferocissimum TaxID=112874 RepID=UPI002815F306|nr:uncharacterized protein LOC132030984 isoform X4 [Lycium ferocissimum]
MEMSRLAWSVSLFPIQRPCASIWGRKASVIRCSSDEFKVLTSVTSKHNNIVILDTPDSRILLLDSSNNVHSILHKGNKWTHAYWGGATAAHLMLELWPSLLLVGWEIDEILIEKAREYLGLSDLEKHTEVGGVLEVRIGDVLSPSVTIPGGYAGIIVDLFSDGKVLPQLEEVTTWLEMNKMLMPSGRLMVNCGAATKELPNTSSDPWELNATINALCEAFPEQVSWKKLPKRAGENYLALTGPLPDLAIWSARLPDQLSSSVKEWRSCTPS